MLCWDPGGERLMSRVRTSAMEMGLMELRASQGLVQTEANDVEYTFIGTFISTRIYCNRKNPVMEKGTFGSRNTNNV
ncbi:hypothetical protein STEG23_034467, partial [Scotinomys teguina]